MTGQVGDLSKSRGLSASISFLPSPPPPRSFTYAIFPAVFDFPRSLLLNRTETLATQASRIGLCSLTSTGSKEVLPGNRKMHLLRRDVRLNDVNWSLVATSLLGNSGYQNDRKIYDQSKMTLRLAISWEPRAKQIRTDLLTSLPLASRWIIPGSIHCHSVINNFNFRVQYLIYTLINFYSSAAMNETTQPVCLFKLFRLGFLECS